MPTSHRTGRVPAGIAHPRVRQFLNIKHNRRPNPDHGVALEGLWSLRQALAASLPVEVVFVCTALLRGDEGPAVVTALEARGAVAFEVSERVFARLVDRDGPDGLAAIGRLRAVGLGSVEPGPNDRVLVCDRFELAGNLGTVIRCADGAGAAAILLTDRRIRLTHPLVVKASMGTLFSVPVVDATYDDARDWLRAHRFRVIAADPDARASYRDADYSRRVAIVLGSERYGLSPFWRDAADQLVSIPMLGTADSLNVGHAAALLLYEALHTRHGGSGPSGGRSRTRPGRSLGTIR